ncbi:MAG: lyase family protein, partial [Desulfobaccales bacterium]
MAQKPWDGRFTGETGKSVEDFTSSLSFDKRLYRQDIAGSVAHARMLGRQGIIPLAEAEEIVRGLNEIAAEIEAGEFPFEAAQEDIHMAVESRLIAKLGEVGGKLHTARSRNDQVALDLRLYLAAEVENLIAALTGLRRAGVGLGRRHLN